MEREESNITRKALLNETFMGLKGLGYECKQLTDRLGLPNIMINQVSKGEIKQTIARDINADLKEEMQNSKKVGDRWMANTMDNNGNKMKKWTKCNKKDTRLKTLTQKYIKRRRPYNRQ